MSNNLVSLKLKIIKRVQSYYHCSYQRTKCGTRQHSRRLF